MAHWHPPEYATATCQIPVLLIHHVQRKPFGFVVCVRCAAIENDVKFRLTI